MKGVCLWVYMKNDEPFACKLCLLQNYTPLGGGQKTQFNSPEGNLGGVKGERALELVLKLIFDEESDNREMTAFFREVALHAEVGGEVID